MAQNQNIGQKISKPKGQAPTDLEQKVGSALIDLQLGSKDLATDISELYICAAKEIEVGGGKKAVVIFVPYRQHSKYKKIQGRLIRELEKNSTVSVLLFSLNVLYYRKISHGSLGKIDQDHVLLHLFMLQCLRILFFRHKLLVNDSEFFLKAAGFLKFCWIPKMM